VSRAPDPAAIRADLRTLVDRIRAEPYTPGQDAVLCLLEAVDLLVPGLDPVGPAPRAEDLHDVRHCLRAASLSLRSRLWQGAGPGPETTTRERTTDAARSTARLRQGRTGP
jgi:hypothetical protein